MPAANLMAEHPREAGLDAAKVDELFKRAEREVNEGLLPSCQIAIARNGKIGAMKAFGHAVQGGADKPATIETLYCVFSCTKAIVSSAIWVLVGEGKLDISERAADIVPEFATNGKDAITVEQLLIHTGGFPSAPYPPRLEPLTPFVAMEPVALRIGRAGSIATNGVSGSSRGGSSSRSASATSTTRR